MKLPNLKTVTSSLQYLVNKLELFAQRHRSRKQLLNLNEHQLRDIGLTRQQVQQEARQYFWQGQCVNREQNNGSSNLQVEWLPDNKSV